MMDTVIGLAFMLAGCAMVAFRKRAGEAIIRSQNQTWGFKFGKREERYSGLVVRAGPAK
jgi:hypothetical protein